MNCFQTLVEFLQNFVRTGFFSGCHGIFNVLTHTCGTQGFGGFFSISSEGLDTDPTTLRLRTGVGGGGGGRRLLPKMGFKPTASRSWIQCLNHSTMPPPCKLFFCGGRGKIRNEGFHVYNMVNQWSVSKCWQTLQMTSPNDRIYLT